MAGFKSQKSNVTNNGTNGKRKQRGNRSHQATHLGHTKSTRATKATRRTYLKITTAKQEDMVAATATKEEKTEVEEVSTPEKEKSAIQIRRMGQKASKSIKLINHAFNLFI